VCYYQPQQVNLHHTTEHNHQSKIFFTEGHDSYRYCSCDTVHLTVTWYCSYAADSLPRVVTMPDDTKAAALCARLETIVKEAEDAEVQATAARRRVQAARLLLEEESKATALEQMATAAR
jgi:negative regulator of replication initiation